MTSLFYGVNWCQSYPNSWILVHFYGSLIFKNVDIKGFVKDGNPWFLLRKFSNDYVNTLFAGKEFTELLNNIYLKDQFLMERMIGHNFSRSMIQKFSLVKENSIKLKK